MFEEDTSPPPPAPAGVGRTAIVILALVIAALAVGGYFWANQQNQKLAQQVAALQDQAKTQAADVHVLQDRLHISAAELARLSSTAADVQSKVSQTQAQLSSTQKQTLTLAQQQQAAASELASVKQDTGAKIGAITGQITGVQGAVSTNHQQITQTQADLEATKAQLKSAIGDLGVQSGLIATTRDQLDVLEKSGQRAFYEFKLTKTKQPVRVGPIELQLKKVDTKHERYTVDVYADDARIEKKDKTLNEPVQFLVGSNHALNEMVVYQLDKNTIVGYVSAPKYPAAAAQAATGKKS
ncbi:MAG TPA: hypothetical protein VIC54_01760 [Terriglobales bacterium]|jgi:hypothetical protein